MVTDDEVVWACLYPQKPGVIIPQNDGLGGDLDVFYRSFSGLFSRGISRVGIEFVIHTDLTWFCQ